MAIDLFASVRRVQDDLRCRDRENSCAVHVGHFFWQAPPKARKTGAKETSEYFGRVSLNPQNSSGLRALLSTLLGGSLEINCQQPAPCSHGRVSDDLAGCREGPNQERMIWGFTMAFANEPRNRLT